MKHAVTYELIKKTKEQEPGAEFFIRRTETYRLLYSCR